MVVPGTMTLRATRRAARALLAAAGLALVAAACAAVGAPRPERPLPPEAERAFAEAQLFLRLEEGPGLDAARDAAERAARLAPYWVAPRRLLDDVDRARLRGPEVLAAHRAALARDPDDAAALYLAGRLEEGERAVELFRRAQRVAPDSPWPSHGLAWALAARGDLRGAAEEERRALERAAGSWERSFFTDSLSRHYAAQSRDAQALEVVLARLAADDLLTTDRTALGVRAALLELERPYGKGGRRGARRALELLRAGGLTAAETRDLVGALTRAKDAVDLDPSEIRLALCAVDGPGRDQLHASLLLREGPSPLALGLLRRALAEDPSALALEPGLRAARFATGEIAAPLEEWLALLPRLALDERGAPADPRLARLVPLAREAEAARGDAHLLARRLEALGRALVDAGWFEDARGVAQALGAVDVERALALEARATAGVALVESMVGLMERVDQREPALVADAGSAATARDLRGLLRALEPGFQRYRDLQSDTRRAPEVRLASSPRLRYGPVGSVVHPGPLFSAEDQELGLGQRGELVGGLAEEFDRIGRFAVFGEALGNPDGTVLRRLLVEQRSGEHLGVRWSGTVAWCEGADVLSRPGRRGARIGGAALHEGYWIDVGTLRSEERHLRGLRRSLEERGAERAVRPTPLGPGESPATPAAPLGEADRVRLALLAERRAAGMEGDLVPLDELVLATAIHEEGHLCDRARFLPLSSKLLPVLGFFAASGFSPQRVEERLEYRAQLTALCTTPEARLPLAEILAAAEQGGGVTPHAAAYRELLRDFLRELDRRAAADPERYPHLDRGALLVHQLHRLTSDEVREIALALARAEGLL